MKIYKRPVFLDLSNFQSQTPLGLMPLERMTLIDEITVNTCHKWKLQWCA